MLSAIANNLVLSISGTAAQNLFYPSVRIIDTGAGFSVEDNDNFATVIPVSGDASALTTLDASGVTGSGVAIQSFIAPISQMTGSVLDDYFFAGADNNVRISGLGGNDVMFSGSGNDRLFGGGGNDELHGGDGDDFFYGGLGNDWIDGGNGIDTLVFSGNRAEYQLNTAGRVFEISHIGGNGAQGTDSFANIEFIQFADQTIAAPVFQSNLVASVTGHTLTVTGAPAGESEFTTVRLSDTGFGFTLTDNDIFGTQIQITGGDLGFSTIDASGLTGSGIDVGSFVASVNQMIGTQQGDYFFSASETNVRVSGLGGDDRITTGSGNDRLFGGSGDDDLNGGDGDDIIFGGIGNDRIDGGNGIDTLVLGGNRADYQLSTVAGRFEIVHVGGNGAHGTDTFANIEFLQFADQTEAISSPPSNLVASVTGNTLSVTGAAAQTEAFPRVSIWDTGFGFAVQDNDSIGTTVPVSGNELAVHAIDASGVTGGGVEVRSFVAPISQVTGSQQADFVYFGAEGNVRVSGLGGDDQITTGGGNDRLFGGSGNDELNSGDGDDFIYGGIGNDTIDGGTGIDTLVFGGNFDEYFLFAVDGRFDILHYGGNAAHGMDSFANIEFLQFADQTVELDNWSV